MLQRGRGVFDYNFHVAIGASSDIIQAFAALVRSEIEDERVDLLRAALTFARIEDPRSISSITCGGWTRWPNA